MKKYEGIIIREGFENKKILDNLETISVKKVEDMDDPKKTWHLHKVKISEEEIESLQKYLKQGWYMHFWDENKKIIAVFKNKIFKFDYNNIKTWEPAVQYGLSIGIPNEQLDFTLD